MTGLSDLTPASGILYIPIHEELYVLWVNSFLGMKIQDWVEQVIVEKAVAAGVWKKEEPIYLRRTFHFPYLVPSNLVPLDAFKVMPGWAIPTDQKQQD